MDVLDVLTMWTVDRYRSSLNQLSLPIFAGEGQDIVYAAIIDLQSWLPGSCARFCFELFSVSLLVDLPGNSLCSVSWWVFSDYTLHSRAFRCLPWCKSISRITTRLMSCLR